MCTPVRRQVPPATSNVWASCGTGQTLRKDVQSRRVTKHPPYPSLPTQGLVLLCYVSELFGGSPSAHFMDAACRNLCAGWGQARRQQDPA
ncbi:hypothetical protein Y1Q_0014730 [Alligator mississippiensis]|uniref:Uncharacterized protein n=1 Tax=Alligator mississippiensis TaxID=8496 RepID=A0A151P873_ALLMI|nr:hypothetical protein Y1Q_0014730 [Alligator mississippiensis]